MKILGLLKDTKYISGNSMVLKQNCDSKFYINRSRVQRKVTVKLSSVKGSYILLFYSLRIDSKRDKVSQPFTTPDTGAPFWVPGKLIGLLQVCMFV